MNFKQVVELKLLGNLITPTAHTLTAMNHRLAITEKTFWRHYRKLRGQGCPHAAKLEAWSTLIHNIATYGSGWWRLDLETLREAH